MHIFEVWAPKARTLSVVVNGTSTAMQNAEGGWWSAPVENVKAGDDYAFCIDGGQPIPDPRSPYQPKGVHGFSRLLDHRSFAWTDTHWQARPLGSGIIYELHIGTFTAEGTFMSAIQRLDYLIELGITHVEMMPVNEFSGDWGWGYDGVDLFAPHHSYGTPDDLKRLVDACHKKGLAVLLDVVYNHFGPAGNYLAHFGPYFTHVYRTPWGSAVNLDHRGSHEARRFFADNALMWLRDYHFDGLRLDAVHAYFDRSALPFLEQLSREVKELSALLGRHLVLIAESDLNDPRLVTCQEAGGLGIDAQWSDDFHHALHSALTGETNGYYEDFGQLEQLATSLQEAFVYSGSYSGHRGRPHGRSARGLSGHRFLGYAQNHDQIGNRAKGERLSHVINAGQQKIAAALVLTSPFIPMLFQGEEFASSSPFLYFTHHEDPDLAISVSEGRREEFAAFGWDPSDVPDPQDPETFKKSKIKWDEVQNGEHADLLHWYKTLIALRRSSPPLTDGRLDKVDVSFDEEARWLVVRRGDVEVACNFAGDSQDVPIKHLIGEPLCSEKEWRLRPCSIELPGTSVAIFVAKGGREF
jgi:maltooligosyltrehalose trehalohydrolase